LAHPVRPDSYIEINNFYTATVYEKGAELVRMLQQMLGPEAFARGVRGYLQTNDGTAATIEDFVDALQNETEADLGVFFAWYQQAGTPHLQVTDSYDAEAQTYELNIQQNTAATPGQPDKKALPIPLKTALYDAQGQQLAAQTLLLEQSQASFSFAQVSSPPVPSLLREFSAPVTLSYHYKPEDLAVLALYESDGFTRWEAMQRLYLHYLLAEGDIDLVIKTCGQLIEHEADPSLLATLLSLPSENQLLEQATAPLYPHEILARRDVLLKSLGEQLESQWAALLQQQAVVAQQAYSPAIAAGRSLRTLALKYLLANGSADWQSRAQSLYKQAQNMTESLAAMHALRDCEGEIRTEVMADFRQRWAEQPLVLDKWFALQATTQFGDPVGRVRACMQDTAFSLKNPNRVRALLGAFLMQNPRGLHAQNGSGYVLWAEVLTALDAINPQVSARLAQALSSWQRYEEQSKSRMQAALNGLLSQTGISNDLYEIITKIGTVIKR
ncbi:MAG: DUF3458 domain-containing protein, partial [Nevskiales bacterium]